MTGLPVTPAIDNLMLEGPGGGGAPWRKWWQPPSAGCC